ncbi:hypothetical protein [Paenibacillus dendritiformis]|uniref:hypothetical protein n=1 Tax=Paenibacillus dendritiformis TaxID=130049 RepID=UPI001408AAE7|nr:hypothetical protein [Paenibacillus dendritiformis]
MFQQKPALLFLSSAHKSVCFFCMAKVTRLVLIVYHHLIVEDAMNSQIAEGAHPLHMPQLILNIGMQASLALPIVINGSHVCRIGSPGTERSTSQAYSPAALVIPLH